MKRRLMTAVACAGLLSSAATLADSTTPFPRLAANWLSNQNYQDPNIQKQLARGNIALINVWPGWDAGRGTTVDQVVKNIKAINPNTKVFLYILNEAVSKTLSQATDPAWLELNSKVNSMKWFLYASGGCCSIVDSFWSGNVTVNNTLYAPTDSNGDRWVDWYAKWAVRNYATPNPSVDGFMTDNFFVKPRVDGDWNRDGKVDSKSDPTVATWQRQGLRRHVDDLHKLMPGKMQMGNISDWGDPDAVLTEYQGQLNGGLIEGALGNSWSIESWNSWSAMMTAYRKIMAALAEPRLAVFQQTGSATDYQGMRYGLGSTLLDNGYYAYNTSTSYGDAPFFDEYNVKLGLAVTGPQTQAWQSGVYRRDFENGIVLVNPKGNGQKTITLETDYKRISGSQAPSVNNGQTVRSVTLQDRDGLILLRLTPKSKPKAPVLAAQ